MNYFFGCKNESYSSSITIPRFNNLGFKDLNYILFSAKIRNEKWSIEEVNCKMNEDFYFVEDYLIDNDVSFFLATKKQITKWELKSKNELVNYNDYTDCNPDYRANLQINSLKNNGYSSYQSEYPSRMTTLKGSLISPISLLLNKKANKNSILVRNIYKLPVIMEKDLFIIDIKKRIIIKHFRIFTNKTNYISLDKNNIDVNYYIVAKNFLGIPIFCSEDKNNNLSVEHTHPPHENIQGKNKFKLIGKMKDEILDIIS